MLTKIEYSDADYTYEHRTSDTAVYAEDDGDILFTLPGHQGPEMVRRVLDIRRAAYHQGVDAGRSALQHEYRQMMGIHQGAREDC